ncbi:hypothetical protein [Fictibacillus sp. NRS-1165]|uniref:hypothetical protein n=1 Tax=Fictibacillus sp. NRS-1165 TaxID=3144463 RepID=UPI003D1A58A5
MTEPTPFNRMEPKGPDRKLESAIFQRSARKVLRKEFGFSDEQIHAFMQALKREVHRY